MKFQVTINGIQYDIERKDDAILVNGEPREVSFHRAGANTYSLLIDHRSYTITVTERDNKHLNLLTRGAVAEAHVRDAKDLLLEKFGMESATDPGEREIRAPMPGLVLRVPVEAGQEVASGDALIVIEAMKMENELRASAGGRVASLHVSPGDAVVKNQLLIEIAA